MVSSCDRLLSPSHVVYLLKQTTFLSSSPSSPLSKESSQWTAWYFFDPDHPVRFRNDQPDTLHRKIRLYLPYANDREDMVNAHGTHVAGTLAGEAINGSRYEQQYNVVLHAA